jgi:hypothetical protein
MRRPKIRGECLDGPRPCPWVSCSYHLGIDVNRSSGRITERPGWWDRPTCALDMADQGGLEYPEIGRILNTSKQRVHQYAVRALEKLREYCRDHGLTKEELELDELDDLRAVRCHWLSMPRGRK